MLYFKTYAVKLLFRCVNTLPYVSGKILPICMPNTDKSLNPYLFTSLSS